MILFDSNILVYAVNVDTPQHIYCRQIVQAVRERKVAGVLFPQNILEFYAIVTDPRRFQSTLAPSEAWQQIKTLTSTFTLLDPSLEAVNSLGSMLNGVTGSQIFDAYLVAQMKAREVSAICTYNKKHFLPFDAIVALSPEELLEIL